VRDARFIRTSLNRNKLFTTVDTEDAEVQSRTYICYGFSPVSPVSSVVKCLYGNRKASNSPA
jgi:hypothetical protein